VFLWGEDFEEVLLGCRSHFEFSKTIATPANLTPIFKPNNFDKKTFNKPVTA